MSETLTTAGARWLRVQHDTSYAYDAPVELAHHVAFLAPRGTPTQLLGAWRLQIDPLPDEWLLPDAPAQPGAIPEQQLSLDPWGNARLAFSHALVHETLAVRSHFEVGLLPAAAIDPALSPPWEQVAEGLRYQAGGMHSEAVEFRLPSLFAPITPALAAFGRKAFRPGTPLAAGAVALMKLIHSEFDYRPASTSVGTRAPESLALRRGVCQDFAHVMIAACRSLGLSARYVSGYLLTQPPPGKPRLVGADASHAWAAVWCPVQGWLALDPTNRVAAGLDHVTLAWGRDYADVAPLRGVIRGGGTAQPHVAVTVSPIEAPGAEPADEDAAGRAGGRPA